MQWPVFSNSLHIGLYKSTNGAAYTQGGEREGEQGDKKEWSGSQGGATTYFLSNCQGKATGTWQCLWCPLLAPAAPLIYHRPGL